MNRWKLFIPRDPAAHERGEEPDSCSRCGHPFAEHDNGICPGQLGRRRRPPSAYGKDLQAGVAGFGDTPAEAMTDFDVNWNRQTLATR